MKVKKVNKEFNDVGYWLGGCKLRAKQEKLEGNHLVTVATHINIIGFNS
jgi:hypothetical protein